MILSPEYVTDSFRITEHLWSGFRNGIYNKKMDLPRNKNKQNTCAWGETVDSQENSGKPICKPNPTALPASPPQENDWKHIVRRDEFNILAYSLAIYHSYGNHHFHKENPLFLWAMASQTEIAQKHSKATYNLETAGRDSLDTLSANYCKLAYNSL